MILCSGRVIIQKTSFKKAIPVLTVSLQLFLPSIPFKPDHYSCSKLDPLRLYDLNTVRETTQYKLWSNAYLWLWTMRDMCNRLHNRLNMRSIALMWKIVLRLVEQKNIALKNVSLCTDWFGRFPFAEFVGFMHKQAKKTRSNIEVAELL